MTIDTPSLVAIIDADENLRTQVAEYLQRRFLKVCGFARAEEFLRERPEVDCLIIDQQLHGIGGDELHAQLLEEGEATSIIMTTRHSAIAKVVAAIDRGALTVLEKPYDLESLCIHVQSGLKHTAAARRAATERDRLANKFRSLTQREREVFRLILSGMHVKQIGFTLGIGVKTVHTFRSHVMKKMDADSNTELILRMVLAFGREGVERIGSLADDESLAELILTT